MLTKITETSSGTVIYGTNAAGVFVGAARRLQTYGALTVAYTVSGPATVVNAATTAPTTAFTAALSTAIQTSFGSSVTTSVVVASTTAASSSPSSVGAATAASSTPSSVGAASSSSGGLSTGGVIGVAIAAAIIGILIIAWIIHEYRLHAHQAMAKKLHGADTAAEHIACVPDADGVPVKINK